ncbi:MAG: TonB-dependent receptor [Brevundimonas sp.]
MKHRAILASASAIALSMGFAGQALAQSGATPQTEATYQVDEIIVTARRQSERLQDVPSAVTAFSSETLYRNQMQTLGDLQAHVPNLSLHVGDASNAVIYLRGIGQIDSISFNDPGVGVYLDDVYLGRVQGSFLEVVDPQQIEVLRGPQGTLYGRNTIGGAVKFTSEAPSETFEGYLAGGVGSYDERRLRARLSGPLGSDQLLGSIAVASSSREGYTENLNDGRSDGDKDLIAGRATLLYQPNDRFSANLTIDASRNTPDRSRTPHRETPIYSVNTGGLRPVIADPYTVDVTYNDLERLETSGAALTLAYDAGPFTFKSISAYRQMEYRTHLDLDASPDQSFGIYDFEEQDQTSQELQVLYRGDRLSAVGGLFYFKENDTTFGGLVGPDFFVDIGFILPFPANTAGLRISDNESIAAYGQLDYELTDRASLTLGVRYTHETKFTDNRGESFVPSVAPTAEDMERLFGQGAGYGQSGYQAEETWDSVTPRIALNYKVSDDILAYVSAAQGFKSGGFNGRITTTPQGYDPETLWSYEAGLKSDLFDGRARLNLAAFFQDYTDLQLSRFAADPVTGDFTSVFDNAGGAEFYGLEAELSVQMSEALRFDGNIAFLHSEYTEYVDGGVDISDQRELVNAPEVSGRAGLAYDLSLGELGDLSLSGGASYRSKTYLTVSSSEILAQDAYWLVDASVLFTPRDSNWTVLLSGKNLGDEAYKEHAFDLSASPGVQMAYYGAPRTVSLDVRYRF